MRVARKSKAGERVVGSFTSDPYPFREAWMNQTRNVIFALRENSCAIVMVLTKNPLLALKDRDIMLSNIVNAKCYSETWLGTTITSTDSYHPFSSMWEPYAPRTKLRLRALREYQREGGYVWVSLEPLIPIDHFDVYPESLVSVIIENLDPDRIKLVVLGRMNYINQLKRIVPFTLPDEATAVKFYREHVPEAIDILKQYGINYHVKKELKKVLRDDEDL